MECRRVSDKLKPNFTPIPNMILDEIMRTLAPGATKVLFGICRYTYGWGKPQGDRISLKQLQEITGMARGSVVRSVKELGEWVTVTAGDPSLQLASEYRINVELSDHDLVSLRDQKPVSKRDQASLLASLPGETFQRKSKEIIHPAFERAWTTYPKRAGNNPKPSALKAFQATVRRGGNIEEMIQGVRRYAEYIRAVGNDGTRFVLQARTFFGPDEHWREAWTLPATQYANGGFVG